MQNTSNKHRFVIIFLAAFTAIIASTNVKSEIFIKDRSIFEIIREIGLKVEFLDQAKDGCWQNPSSAENKAISLLNQYGLYNSNSYLTLFVASVGSRANDGPCAVRWDARLEQIFPTAGYMILGETGGIFTGHESQISDAIRSEVESFIEELVAKMAKEGI